MDIVIVGAGEVGYHLADILSREEHRVCVVDPDPTQGQRIMEALDAQVLIGDGDARRGADQGRGLEGGPGRRGHRR